MLEISPEKVAHVIVKSREFDAKVAIWDEPSSESDTDDLGDAILEDRASDATRSGVADFIANLNEDEQVNLVALTWVGRGTYAPEEFAEAVNMARAERTSLASGRAKRFGDRSSSVSASSTPLPRIWSASSRALRGLTR